MIVLSRPASPGWLLTLILTLLLACPVLATASRSDTEDEKTKTKTVTTTVIRGRASWYGREHQGHRTSSGERFNRFKYTCAHKTLPFGTRLRVTNPDNGKSVVVRVTDRGPFRHQRVLDLSEIAARPLAIVQQGAHDVVAEVVASDMPLGPTDTPEALEELLTISTDSIAARSVVVTLPVFAVPTSVVVPASARPVFIVQAGTFGSLRNAESQQARIQALTPQLTVTIATETVNGKALNRVVTSPFADWRSAEKARQTLGQYGIIALVRRSSESAQPAGPLQVVAAK